MLHIFILTLAFNRFHACQKLSVEPSTPSTPGYLINAQMKCLKVVHICSSYSSQLPHPRPYTSLLWAPARPHCSPVARMNKWMKSRAGKTNPQLQSAGAEKNADLQILLTDFCHGEWLMTVSTIHMAVEAYVCVSHELRTWAVSLYIIKRLRNTRKHWSSSCLADNSLFFDESVSYWWLCCESVIWSQRGITLIPLLVSGT